jgi:hypothetical protein
MYLDKIGTNLFFKSRINLLLVLDLLWNFHTNQVLVLKGFKADFFAFYKIDL